MTDLEPLRGTTVQLVVRAWSTHGGTERYCHGLALWLRERDVQPVVWCQEIRLDPGGLDVRQMGPTGRGRVGRMWATNRAAARVAGDGLRVGFLRAPGFHVLRAGGGSHAAAMRALGSWRVADHVERAVDLRALRTAGVVVANSEMSRKDILQDTERTPLSVCVVRNGVDLAAFSPKSDFPRERAVVFVGHGFARKGLATALQAVALIPGVPLWVVGRDRHEGTYRRLANKLGISDRVHFMGPVDDPASVMRRAGALVLPTRYDPSANVVLESMACGVPPVTTRGNGASEVLPMPWLVVDEPDDATAIAAALHRALAEPDLGMRCRQVAENWSQDRSYSEFAAVLVAADQARREGR